MAEGFGFMNVIMIDDSYYEELRKIAVREQKTVVQVISDGLQKHIKARNEAAGEVAPVAKEPQVLCG